VIRYPEGHDAEAESQATAMRELSLPPIIQVYNQVMRERGYPPMSAADPFPMPYEGTPGPVLTAGGWLAVLGDDPATSLEARRKHAPQTFGEVSA